MLEARTKIWIEKDGVPVFGDGRCELLKAIGFEGSLNKAAKKLGMSYRQAWGEVNLMEERFNVKLVERRTGRQTRFSLKSIITGGRQSPTDERLGGWSSLVPSIWRKN